MSIFRTLEKTPALLVLPLTAASMTILALARQGWQLWSMQLLAIGLACGLALIGQLIARRSNAKFPAAALLCITVVGLAVPLLSPSNRPERWISIGPMNLYAAPMLIPAFLIACASCLTSKGLTQYLAGAAIVGVGIILAIQPDASQCLALMVAISAMLTLRACRSITLLVALMAVALSTAGALSHEAPMPSVYFVEEVFDLALTHSPFYFLIVAGSAIALIVALLKSADADKPWRYPLAAYFCVLYACSIFGLTPAPMIGYGAGPWLGFGLMLAAASWHSARQSSKQNSA